MVILPQMKAWFWMVFSPSTQGGKTIGGLLARRLAKTSHLSVLWIAEEYRGAGIGSQLLDIFEEEAKTQVVEKVFIDSYEFQAPEFYKKHGYKVITEIPDFLGGYGKLYLSKEL